MIVVCCLLFVVCCACVELLQVFLCLAEARWLVLLIRCPGRRAQVETNNPTRWKGNTTRHKVSSHPNCLRKENQPGLATNCIRERRPLIAPSAGLASSSGGRGVVVCELTRLRALEITSSRDYELSRLRALEIAGSRVGFCGRRDRSFRLTGRAEGTRQPWTAGSREQACKSSSSRPTGQKKTS